MDDVNKNAQNGFVPEDKAEDGFLKSLFALDAAALQWIYGIKAGYYAKDNSYHFPRSSPGG